MSTRFNATNLDGGGIGDRMPETIPQPGPPQTFVDFHNHYVGPSFPLTTLAGVPPAQRAFWEGVNRQLTEQHALLSSIEEGGIDARVVSTPLEFLRDRNSDVPAATISRINDGIAGLVSRHPGQLYGLATVDAYSGEAGARELTRAVDELGLRGVFVESAKGDLLPDAKEARPTFAAAAALRVPVFLHPVEDPQLSDRFRRYGRLGMRLTRGTINSAALFAVLESGMLDEMPNAQIVVTALALGGLLLAGGFGDGTRLRKDAPSGARRHVYVDTTGLHPAMLRCAVDLLGADHVLLGTDWPIAVEPAARMRAALDASGLDLSEQQMVAGANTLKLLGIA